MLDRSLVLYILAIAFLGACASPHQVASEYNDLKSSLVQSKSNRTVIFFLIDGLPLQLVSDEFKAGRIPSIRRFFVSKTNTFFVAHTSFPSATFPSIASLITERPIDQHGVFGNLIVDQDGETVSFESPNHFPLLNKMIRGKNIFSRMSTKEIPTVSLAYAFNADSSVHIPSGDIKLGYAILDKNYSYVDNLTIKSLENLLTNTEPSKWPGFVFVHLIGLDLTSHDRGPDSPAVIAYLNNLDRQLNLIFATIEKVERERKREIIALMSSDHGFDLKVSKYLNLEQALREFDPRIKVLNEGRFASIYFPPDWSPSKKEDFMNSWSLQPLIDVVAFRENEKVFFYSKINKTTMLYSNGLCDGSNFSISILPDRFSKCPESLGENENSLYYPYFISNMSHYFQSPFHPDAVIIPNPGVAFYSKNKGQHGGPTPREVFVPLLMHNATLANPQQSPALWQLLRFL